MKYVAVQSDQYRWSAALVDESEAGPHRVRIFWTAPSAFTPKRHVKRLVRELNRQLNARGAL